MGKVLVVDDDEALRRLMRVQLSQFHEVIDSGEPERGLALALEHKPDAILLDLRMPKYSGYDLLQTFTSFSHTQKIPVIVVSGEGGAQTKENCRKLGAAQYFEKPIDFDALRQCLSELAKNHQHTPRSEVRVRLCVALKLTGTDVQSRRFETMATTENVSLSGFLCCCGVEIPVNSVLDVYIGRLGDQYVGKAKVVHCHSSDDAMKHYGCRFTEKTGPWVLE